MKNPMDRTYKISLVTQPLLLYGVKDRLRESLFVS